MMWILHFEPGQDEDMGIAGHNVTSKEVSVTGLSSMNVN